jgi:hypothetical protein
MKTKPTPYPTNQVHQDRGMMLECVRTARELIVRALGRIEYCGVEMPDEDRNQLHEAVAVLDRVERLVRTTTWKEATDADKPHTAK